MKAMLLTPPPSTTPKPKADDDDNDNDVKSSYYPKCRKDANCNCEMCLASINATLDLVPTSTLTKRSRSRSISKPALQTTPVSIDPTLLSTPMTTPSPSPSPVHNAALRSNLKSDKPRECGVKMGKLSFRKKYLWVLVLFGMMLAFEVGVSWGVCWFLRPVLSGNVVNDVIRNCSGVDGLSERLNSVRRGLEAVVGDRVSSCNLDDSTWKIDQDGLLMHSYCIMYQSAAEEVIIRGWPLQTAGLLTAAFSSRSFSVLFGKLIEWPEGNMVHVVHAENSTWILRKWGASVVKFDANTWIIEYTRNMFSEDPNILLGVLRFLNFRISKFVLRMKRHLWLLPDLSNYAAYTSERSSRLPT